MYLKKIAIVCHRYENQSGIILDNTVAPCVQEIAMLVSSQIFEERTFGKLNTDEMNLFMTQRSFESHCQTCQKTVTSIMKLFLIYVSIASLKQTGFDISCWPLSVSHIFKKPKKMVCKHCSESNVSDPICASAVNSKFVFMWIQFINIIIQLILLYSYKKQLHLAVNRLNYV